MGNANSTGKGDRDIDTPLMSTVKANSPDATTRVLRKGVTPDDAADSLWLAITLDRAEVANKLIPICMEDCEQDVVVRLFCYAAFNGSTTILQQFLAVDEGLAAAAEVTSGQTALDFALLAGRTDVLRLLESQGATASRGKESELEELQCDPAATTIQAEGLPRTLRTVNQLFLPPAGQGATVQSGSDSSSTVSIAEAAIAVGFMMGMGENIPFTHVLPCGEAGHGAFGKVALGYYQNRPVAFKVESRSCDGATEMGTNRMIHFAREARVLRVLEVPTHPHVVGFIGVAVDPDVGIAIVTEYVSGGTLRSRLENGGLDSISGLAVCAGLAAGLAYIHETGIVHGDIKPANILMAGVCAKIIDFGGAYPYWRGKTAKTPLYAAPEVLGGGLTEAKSDVYSLACVMYKVLTGEQLSAKRCEKASDIGGGSCTSTVVHNPVETVEEGTVSVDSIVLGEATIEAAEESPIVCESGTELCDHVESQLPLELRGLGIGQLLARCWVTISSTRPRSSELYATLLSMLHSVDAATAGAIAEAHCSAPPVENSPLMEVIHYGEFGVVMELLETGLAADHTNRWGRTPLHVAAALNDVAVARLLLEAGSQVVEDQFGVAPQDILRDLTEFGEDVSELEELLPDVGVEHNSTPPTRSSLTASEQALLDAVRQGDVGRVRVLMDRGVSAGTPDEKGISAVEIACRCGRADVVSLIMSTMDKGMWLNSGEWELLFDIAYKNHDPRMVESIARAMVTVDGGRVALGDNLRRMLLKAMRTRNSYWLRSFAQLSRSIGTFSEVNVHWIPLHTACREGNNFAVQQMLQANADVNLADTWSQTALMVASKEGHSEIVIALLEYGASVNACTENGETALMLASKKGHLAVVEMLIMFGATTTYRGTPLMSASPNDLTEFATRFEARADVNATRNDGRSALMLASGNGHSGVVAVLLKAGANMNATDKGGATALVIASQGGHTVTMTVLLGARAAVETARENGQTALMSASRNGHKEAVATLCGAGADVNAAMEDGSTALMSASQNGHHDVVAVLHEAGADVNAAKEDGWTALMMASENGHRAVVTMLVEFGADVSMTTTNGFTALMFGGLRGHAEAVAALLEAGASVNTTNSSGWTALMWASRNGHVDVVAGLLAAGADVNTAEDDGGTALMLASDSGHLAVVEVLIEFGADVSNTTTNGFTALMFGCLRGHAEVVATLIEAGASVNTTNSSGWTALMWASRSGHVDVVAGLLAAGADVNTAEDDGWTALMLASDSGHLAVVEVLIESWADVSAAITHGSTALMLASQHGHNGAVAALLEAGADVNTAKEDGWTALMMASENGHRAVVTMLVEFGADVSMTTTNGFTALMFGGLRGHAEAVAALLEAGASVNTTNSSGWTALMWASRNGHVDVVAGLLAAGADVDAALKDGWTALTFASQQDHLAVVGMLIESGANASAPDTDGYTALIIASQIGHRSVVAALLDAGADVNTATRHMRTALMLASSRGHLAVVEMLIEAGAEVNAATANGWTALMSASVYGHEEVVVALLAEGADVTAVTRGRTAVEYARSNGHDEIVALLEEHARTQLSSNSM